MRLGRVRMALSLLSIAVFLCGCTGQLSEDQTIIDQMLDDTWEKEWVIPDESEIPVVLPGVLVDCLGYSCNGEKTAFFCGDNLSNTFEVIRYDTEEVVYTGEIKEGGTDSQSKEVVSHGDFSSVTEEGTYCIRTDGIGYSYPFAISDSIHEEVFSTLQKEIFESSECEADAVLRLMTLMSAYEMNKAAFTDDCDIEESGNNIPDLLDELKKEMDLLAVSQNIQTGMVEANGEEDVEATALFAGAMAQFGRIYQEMDAEYAQLCLQRAEVAYQAVPITYDDEEISYLMNVQLFRTTGRYTYHANIKRSIEKNPELGLHQYNQYVFLADVIYLTTPANTAVKICSARMEYLTEYTKTYCENAKEDCYLTGDSMYRDSEDVPQMLQSMEILGFVNYVITNREYRTILEDQLHFIAGRNPERTNYFPITVLDDLEEQKEEEAYSAQDLDQDAMLIFVFAIYS